MHYYANTHLKNVIILNLFYLEKGNGNTPNEIKLLMYSFGQVFYCFIYLDVIIH